MFEYTDELAWKTLKDFLANRGNTSIFGSKDATREAFKLEMTVLSTRKFIITCSTLT